jgi:hypothetical protein
LDKETLLLLDLMNHTSLAYSDEHGFFINRYHFAERPDFTKYVKMITTTYFEDQNKVMKRLKELINEEEVKAEEVVDGNTLRFYHAIRM